jgi:L-alanine-DL-glutamate epimerase-like enolase superfamily enzyme
MDKEGKDCIEKTAASAYTIPTDRPEADGTISWTSTTLVLVEVSGNGETGIGYSYTSSSAVSVIREVLAPVIEGNSIAGTRMARQRMIAAVRNLGQFGIAMAAVSAVETALWDLLAHVAGLPLFRLLGSARESIPAYGSGGFTSYSEAQLQAQLSGWVNSGIRSVKMKVGTDPSKDVERVRLARIAIGDKASLFVDANGAYSRKEAINFAQRFAEHDVSWFEEPVATEDLGGMRMLRDNAPASMEVAGGEYGYSAEYFRRMLESGAVDVLQCDATRCGGVSGFLDAASLCTAFHIPLSSHTAPSLHCHLCCASEPAIHAEYFHDHVRIEQMLFDGAPKAVNGELKPDTSRPGWGLDFKRQDASQFMVT